MEEIRRWCEETDVSMRRGLSEGERGRREGRVASSGARYRVSMLEGGGGSTSPERSCEEEAESPSVRR